MYLKQMGEREQLIIVICKIREQKLKTWFKSYRYVDNAFLACWDDTELKVFCFLSMMTSILDCVNMHWEIN